MIEKLKTVSNFIKDKLTDFGYAFEDAKSNFSNHMEKIGWKRAPDQKIADSKASLKELLQNGKFGAVAARSFDSSIDYLKRNKESIAAGAAVGTYFGSSVLGIPFGAGLIIPALNSAFQLSAAAEGLNNSGSHRGRLIKIGGVLLSCVPYAFTPVPNIIQPIITATGLGLGHFVDKKITDGRENRRKGKPSREIGKSITSLADSPNQEYFAEDIASDLLNRFKSFGGDYNEVSFSELFADYYKRAARNHKIKIEPNEIAKVRQAANGITLLMRPYFKFSNRDGATLPSQVEIAKKILYGIENNL